MVVSTGDEAEQLPRGVSSSLPCRKVQALNSCGEDLSLPGSYLPPYPWAHGVLPVDHLLASRPSLRSLRLCVRFRLQLCQRTRNLKAYNDTFFIVQLCRSAMAFSELKFEVSAWLRPFLGDLGENPFLHLFQLVRPPAPLGVRPLSLSLKLAMADQVLLKALHSDTHSSVFFFHTGGSFWAPPTHLDNSGYSYYFRVA